MSVLQAVKHYRAERRRLLRQTAIGADPIPRGQPDDARYANVDLVARGRAIDVLELGQRRLRLTSDQLPADVRDIAERIGEELRQAGPEEVGRWATDVLHAYCDVPYLSPVVETAMYLAWALSVDEPISHLGGRESEPPRQDHQRPEVA